MTFIIRNTAKTNLLMKHLGSMLLVTTPAKKTSQNVTPNVSQNISLKIENSIKPI